MGKRPLLLLLTLVSAAVAAAACSGSGGGGDTTTPSPTPTFVPDGCQIVWMTNVTPGPGGLVDFYVVDMVAADWTVGTHLYANPSPRGVFFKSYDLTSGAYAARATATTGTFTMIAATTTNQHFVHFEDTVPQHYFLLDTNGSPAADEGTGGTGSFSGGLSDPYAQNVTPGTGTVTILFDGTARTIGSDLAYAICYVGTSPIPPRAR